MLIKKVRNETKLPTKAYEGDAGFDVYAPLGFFMKAGETRQIKLGFAMQIYENEVCIMSERSGMAIKYGLTSIGNVIDSGYRGEVSIILFNSGPSGIEISKGDKIGQMLIMKLGDRNIREVEELEDSERGDKAHNSSGF